MIRKWLTVLVLLALPGQASAQLENPVKWSFASKKVNPRTYELHITATVEPGWRLYAQEAGEGPVPTSFKLAKNPPAAATGQIKEIGKLHNAYDKNFDSELKWYENQVKFVQTVTVKASTATKVKGSVEFMVCDDHQCLPPKQVDFAIAVGGN